MYEYHKQQGERALNPTTTVSGTKGEMAIVVRDSHDDERRLSKPNINR